MFIGNRCHAYMYRSWNQARRQYEQKYQDKYSDGCRLAEGNLDVWVDDKLLKKKDEIGELSELP